MSVTRQTTKTTKTKKRGTKRYPTPHGAGLRVITERDLRARMKRAFWKGVYAVHRDLFDRSQRAHTTSHMSSFTAAPSIPIEEVDRLEGVFEAYWKVQQ